MKRILQSIARAARRAARLLALGGVAVASLSAQPFTAVQRNASGVLVVGGTTASLSIGTGGTLSNSGLLIQTSGGMADLRLGTVSLASASVINALGYTPGTGSLSGLTLSASTGLTAAVTTSTSTPQLTITLSNALLGWNATTSASFPTFTQLSGSLSSYQLIVPNLTGWAATSSASYPTFANMTASFSSYPAASVSGTLHTVSVSGQPIVTMTSGSTLTLIGGGGVTLSTSATGAVTISTSVGAGTVTGLVITPSGGLLAGVTLSTSVPTITISSPIFKGITGSASPAANSASLSMGSGTTITHSGSGTISLSAGLNTFATAASFSGPVKITDATASTGTTSGAGVITGGLGVGGGVFSTTMSTGTFTTSGTTLAMGGGGLISYDAGNSFFSFSSFGSAAKISGLIGSSATMIGVTNGVPPLTITYASTTYGGNIVFWNNSFSSVFGIGGSTAGVPLDGVAVANKLYISVNGTSSISLTIESNSGAITIYRGLTVSNGGALTGTFAGTKTFSGATVISTSSNITTSAQIQAATFSGTSAAISGAVNGGSADFRPGLLQTGSLSVTSTISAASLTLSANATISGTLQANIATISGTLQANIATISGTLQANTDTISGDVYFPNIATSGSTQFLGGDGEQVDWLSVADATTLLGVSDARVKTNISSFTDGAALVNQINPIRFNFTGLSIAGKPDGRNTKAVHLSVRAQDIQKILPEAVSALPDGTLSVDDRALLMAVINNVKELNARLDALEKK